MSGIGSGTKSSTAGVAPQPNPGIDGASSEQSGAASSAQEAAQDLQNDQDADATAEENANRGSSGAQFLGTAPTIQAPGQQQGAADALPEGVTLDDLMMSKPSHAAQASMASEAVTQALEPQALAEELNQQKEHWEAELKRSQQLMTNGAELCCSATGAAHGARKITEAKTLKAEAQTNINRIEQQLRTAHQNTKDKAESGPQTSL